MAYVTTGENLTITINSQDYSPQCSSVELAYEAKIETYQTLTGPTSIKTGTSGTLTLSIFQDWAEASSLAEAMWTAAEAGDSVAFVLTVGGASGTAFAGFVVPQFPTVGGGADAALEASITLTVDGVVTMDTTP